MASTRRSCFSKLSGTLRNEILQYNSRELASLTPMLRNTPPQVFRALSQHLSLVQFSTSATLALAFYARRGFVALPYGCWPPSLRRLVTDRDAASGVASLVQRGGAGAGAESGGVASLVPRGSPSADGGLPLACPPGGASPGAEAEPSRVAVAPRTGAGRLPAVSSCC